MPPRKTILVVEDDGAVREMIAAFLRNAGHEVMTASDGYAMQQILENSTIDLVVLDLNLPDADGMDLARQVRSRSRIGIVMLTERDAPQERAAGLELGADDYIGKPFYPRELLARINNVLARAPSNVDFRGEPTLKVGGWLVDPDNRLVLDATGGRDARLTAAEFNLLMAFMQAPGRLLDRTDLAVVTAGTMPASEAKGDAGGRSVDVLVSRLRHKLGDEGEERMIETVRGHGYRLAVPVTPA